MLLNYLCQSEECQQYATDRYQPNWKRAPVENIHFVTAFDAKSRRLNEKAFI